MSANNDQQQSMSPVRPTCAQPCLLNQAADDAGSGSSAANQYNSPARSRKQAHLRRGRSSVGHAIDGDTDAVGSPTAVAQAATHARHRSVTGIRIPHSRCNECTHNDTVGISAKTKSVESLAIALEKSVVYSYHLLNEFAPEIVRRNAAHNALAMQNGDYHSVILPDLQIVLARLRKLLNARR